MKQAVEVVDGPVGVPAEQHHIVAPAGLLSHGVDLVEFIRAALRPKIDCSEYQAVGPRVQRTEPSQTQFGG